jgi:photosystem II stability/assembly factor-like uncharacterized protein
MPFRRRDFGDFHEEAGDDHAGGFLEMLLWGISCDCPPPIKVSGPGPNGTVVHIDNGGSGAREVPRAETVPALVENLDDVAVTEPYRRRSG